MPECPTWFGSRSPRRKRSPSPIWSKAAWYSSVTRSTSVRNQHNFAHSHPAVCRCGGHVHVRWVQGRRQQHAAHPSHVFLETVGHLTGPSAAEERRISHLPPGQRGRRPPHGNLPRHPRRRMAHLHSQARATLPLPGPEATEVGPPAAPRGPERSQAFQATQRHAHPQLLGAFVLSSLWLHLSVLFLFWSLFLATRANGYFRPQLQRPHTCEFSDSIHPNIPQTEGYLPEAVNNWLAMLGWNPGTTQEVCHFPPPFAADFDLHFGQSRLDSPHACADPSDSANLGGGSLS